MAPKASLDGTFLQIAMSLTFEAAWTFGMGPGWTSSPTNINVLLDRPIRSTAWMARSKTFVCKLSRCFSAVSLPTQMLISSCRCLLTRAAALTADSWILLVAISAVTASPLHREICMGSFVSVINP